GHEGHDREQGSRLVPRRASARPHRPRLQDVRSGDRRGLRFGPSPESPAGDSMKKFINDIDAVMRESLGGLVEAHPGLLRVEFEPTFIARATKSTKKVALLSGGGSGHEPLHAGFVGLGMLDADCPGQVFTSPTPDQMIEAAEAVDTGAGVLFIVKNYEGDLMNFTMAAEMAGREIASVVTKDDVAVQN